MPAGRRMAKSSIRSGCQPSKRNNVLFGAKGKVQFKRLKNYSQAGVVAFEGDDENVLADPLLVEYNRGVVTFAGDSPVFKLGIKPIDVSDAGRRKTRMRE